MYDEKKWNADRKKNKHGHKQKVIFDITTDYSRIEDKMYLNYISFHNSFVLNIPPAFKVDYITVDRNKRCFTVEYNKVPMTELAMDISNYTVKFKGKRIKVKETGRFNNRVFLFPDLEGGKITKMISEILVAETKGKDLRELVDVKVHNVKDTQGNLVNKWTQKEYQQYREFFVQRVKLDSIVSFDNLFMNKEKPIFQNQPIARPKDYEDYWMNTPLKTN